MTNAFIPAYITEQILNARSPEEIKQIASKYLEDLGFSKFAFCFGWQKSKKKFDNVTTLLTDYPDEWVRRYTDELYVYRDLIHYRSLNTVTPFSWSSLQTREITSESALVFNEATEFNMHDGISVPIRSGDNTFSLLSAVAGGSLREREEVVRRNAGTVMILASFLHERGSQLFSELGHSQIKHEPASEREREVLKWVASGKSSADIADILHISEATVNKHIENVMKKFHATTRSHAAVQAVMSGLIEPVG